LIWTVLAASRWPSLNPAILIYLAEKTGKLLPKDPRERYTVLQWLMFQMAGVGPMMGQANHFRNAAPEKISYAIERYVNESHRLANVMDKRLSEAAYLGGEYSIADIATFPWARAIKREPDELDKRPNLKRWLEAINQRPAVKRGLAVMADMPQQPLDDEARSICTVRSSSNDASGPIVSKS
jgi:GSH-dependent disulfide-bond oxidoreductase